MVNRIVLVGRMANDPELKYTPSGVAVSSFRIAVARPFSNAQGEKETDFIDVVTWRQNAEFAAKYLGKGRLIAVEGRLQVRSYQAQDGTRRRVYEVVCDSVRGLDSPKETGDRPAGGAPPGGGAAPPEEAHPYDDPFQDE